MTVDGEERVVGLERLEENTVDNGDGTPSMLPPAPTARRPSSPDGGEGEVARDGAGRRRRRLKAGGDGNGNGPGSILRL